MDLFGGWDEKYTTLCDKLDALTDALHEFPKNDQTHSPQMREWERFVLRDGGTCDGSGNGTVGGPGTALVPAGNGWEGYITAISVTVSGASAAATVANYHGGADDLNLFDYAGSMIGNTPSRTVAFYDLEVIYFNDGAHLTIAVTGAVATASVKVRVSGKRRQV